MPGQPPTLPTTTSSVPVMMMMPPAPPAIPYPTKKSSLSSKLFPHSSKGKQAYATGADMKSSAYSSYSKLSSHSSSLGKGSPTTYSKLSSSDMSGPFDTPPSPTLGLPSPYSDSMAPPTNDWFLPSLDSASGDGSTKGDDELSMSSWASWKPKVNPLPEKHPVAGFPPYPFYSQSSSPTSKGSTTSGSSSFSRPPEYSPPHGPSATSPFLFGPLGKSGKTSSAVKAPDSLFGSPTSLSSWEDHRKGGVNKSKAPFPTGSKYSLQQTTSKVTARGSDSHQYSNYC
jgi:hypothetical protein